MGTIIVKYYVDQGRKTLKTSILNLSRFDEIAIIDDSFVFNNNGGSLGIHLRDVNSISFYGAENPYQNACISRMKESWDIYKVGGRS